MENLSKRQIFIEEAGLLFEQIGITRMAGRICGLMMITDKELVSFNEITEILNASKSSISNNVKLLINLGFIKMVTIPTDRKTYYMLNHELDLAKIAEREMQSSALFVKTMRKAIELRINKNDKQSIWLKELCDFQEWLLDEIPNLIKSYYKSRGI